MTRLTDCTTDVNMGQQILVRLRYAGTPDAFLPQEEVVGTMLHEVRDLSCHQSISLRIVGTTAPAYPQRSWSA